MPTIDGRNILAPSESCARWRQEWKLAFSMPDAKLDGGSWQILLRKSAYRRRGTANAIF